MKYKLFAATYCPYCHKVESFIKNEGIEDQIEVVYTDKDPDVKAELLEKGGKTQVPCLHFDDQWLYESGDIIDYLRENVVNS